jgi:hypothetical protein
MDSINQEIQEENQASGTANSKRLALGSCFISSSIGWTFVHQALFSCRCPLGERTRLLSTPDHANEERSHLFQEFQQKFWD